MPVSFEQILNSRLFKFIVGEAVDSSPSEFSVHEDAIAQLSNPLHTLTKSSPEGRAGCAIWKDVSNETFERFVQYAYTGDYSIPKTGKRSTAAPRKVNGIHPKTTNVIARPENGENAAPSNLSSPSAPTGIRGRLNSLGSDETSPVEVRDGSVSEKMEEEGSILNYPMPSKKQKKKKAAKAAQEKAEKEAREAELKQDQEMPPEPEPELQQDTKSQPHLEETQPVESEPELAIFAGQEKPLEQHILTTDFKSLSYTLLASRDNYEGTCEPCTDFEKDHCYSDVFLIHASLYVLGDVQLVDSLKALALFKLHKTLCVFELDNENIADITDLARYAYSGEDKELEEGIGGLRGLVCQYMAIHAKELSVDARFMNLLAGGGQIVKDFFQFQLQRIQ